MSSCSRMCTFLPGTPASRIANTAAAIEAMPLPTSHNCVFRGSIIYFSSLSTILRNAPQPLTHSKRCLVGQRISINKSNGQNLNEPFPCRRDKLSDRGYRNSQGFEAVPVDSQLPDL